MSLDRIDSQILAALQNNARLSNKQLAAQVGLAPSSCLERVRRLMGNGVIIGAHAEVDPSALGIGLRAMVGVWFAHHSRDDVQRFRREILELPEVTAVYYLSGSIDFMVQVAVRDSAHLRDFVLDSLTTRSVVARVETSLIFDAARAPELPDYS